MTAIAPTHMVRAIPCLLAGMLMLSGCAGPVRVDLAQRDLPQQWRNVASAASAPAPDLDGWWRAFGDPELDRLVGLALVDNLSLQQAVKRVEAARFLRSQSAAAFRPNLGFHTAAAPTPDSSASYFQASLEAQWEFALFGRARSHAQVAQADIEMARSDAQAARVSVVAEVARTYLELRAAHQQVLLLQRLVADQNEKLALTRIREQARLASAVDRHAASADIARSEMALAGPSQDIVRCEQQLALLLGRSEPVALAAADLPTLGALRVATAPADLLRTRPDIRHAEHAVLKAAGEAGVARADLYPRLGLGGAVTWSTRMVGNTEFGSTDRIVSLGPVIDIPLFNWGARRAVVDARDAALAATVLDYRQTILGAVAETETALGTLELQRMRIAAATRALAALDAGAAATQVLLNLGLADRIDQTAAGAAAVHARIDHLDAVLAHDLAFVALYKALGGAARPEATP